MGFKQSKCFEEKSDPTLSKTRAATVDNKKKKKKKKKQHPVSASVSVSPSRTMGSQRPHNLPTDASIPDIVANFNCSKNDRQNSRPMYTELFENEDQSDVTFLVGAESWRFPGHKHVLAPASPVFHAMLKGSLSSNCTKEEIPIEDVDPRAFENILRFVYIGEVKLLTIQATLDTLYATDKYMIPELTRLCLEVLEFSLSVNNVLAVHHGIRLFSSVWSCEHVCGKGSHQTEKQDQSQDTAPAYIPVLHTLQNRCLEIIDSYAEQILTSEELGNLSHMEVSEIVFRNTLQVNSETSVFEALHRWAIQQCKCNQKEMTWSNKRDCLKGALFAVRYILMTKDEFMAGPGSTGLLTPAEKDWILAKITGQAVLDIPTELINRERYLERRRGYPPPAVVASDSEQPSAPGGSVNQGDFTNLMTTKPYVDPWCDKSKNKHGCRVSKVFTECFVCFSLLFD